MIGNPIAKYFNKEIHSYIKYDSNISQNVSDNLISRMVKTTGIRNLAIIGQGSCFTPIQTSIINKKIVKNGNMIILSNKSIYFAVIEGGLIVVESGLESSQSAEDYEHKAINSVLAQLNSSKASITDSEALAFTIKKLYPNGIAPSSYSIINIQNTKKKTVGTINSTVSIFDSIIYPGNTTNPATIPFLV